MSFIDNLKNKVSELSNKDVSLDKYLPNTLFIGVQKDVSEKALKGYILSLSKTAFENVGDVKYFIKKLKKDEFLYEIHNGSIDLSYLSLVHNSLFVENKDEVILKCRDNNVRITKKASGKIETSVLIEKKSTEEDVNSLVDKKTKGKMTLVVREGLGLFYVSSLFMIVTGVIAATSFVTKYTMLNEDYSFSYEKDNSLSPMEFIESLRFNDHSEHKYLKSIKYSDGKWKEEYGIVEKAKKDVNAPKIEDVEKVESMNDESDDVVVEMVPVVTMEEVVEIKPVITMEKVVTLKPVVTMEEVIVSDVVVNDINDVEIIDVEELPRVNLGQTKTKRNFEIIDMDTLDNLDLSNLPSNVVIEKENK